MQFFQLCKNCVCACFLLFLRQSRREETICYCINWLLDFPLPNVQLLWEKTSSLISPLLLPSSWHFNCITEFPLHNCSSFALKSFIFFFISNSSSFILLSSTLFYSLFFALPFYCVEWESFKSWYNMSGGVVHPSWCVRAWDKFPNTFCLFLKMEVLSIREKFQWGFLLSARTYFFTDW